MKNLLLLSLILLSFYGCREKEDSDPNVLPPATQTGANTGGALVNGEVWVATKFGYGSNNGGVDLTQYTQYDNGEYKLKIVLRQLGNTSNRILIHINNTNEIIAQNYILNNLNIAGYELGSIDYNTDIENTGVLTITKFDRNKNIVSGTFEFDAINVNGEVLHITEGRFDKKFSQ